MFRVQKLTKHASKTRETRKESFKWGLNWLENLKGDTNDVCCRPWESNIAATTGPGTPWSNGSRNLHLAEPASKTTQRKVSAKRTVRIRTLIIQRGRFELKTEFTPSPHSCPRSIAIINTESEVHREGYQEAEVTSLM